MFNFIHVHCPRCGGCITDEWKLDMPEFRELVCINCGFRAWQKLEKRGRKRKLKSGLPEKWTEQTITAEILNVFNEERRRQILKHRTPRQNKWKKMLKLRGFDNSWIQT